MLATGGHACCRRSGASSSTCTAAFALALTCCQYRRFLSAAPTVSGKETYFDSSCSLVSNTAIGTAPSTIEPASRPSGVLRPITNVGVACTPIEFAMSTLSPRLASAAPESRHCVNSGMFAASSPCIVDKVVPLKRSCGLPHSVVHFPKLSLLGGALRCLRRRHRGGMHTWQAAEKGTFGPIGRRRINNLRAHF